MTFTDILNAYGVDPDSVIEDEQQQESADEAASEEVGTIGSPEAPPELQTKFDLPSFGKQQFELLTSLNLARGNPNTGQEKSVFAIELEVEHDDGEPLDNETVSFDVSVTDHLGTDPFDEAPNDGLVGSTRVNFLDGEGSFTIGGADSDGSDLTLGFFGFLPKVNDVETIEITTQDDVTIVGRSVDLAPDITNQSAVASVQDSRDSAQEPKEGFTETIEERK